MNTTVTEILGTLLILTLVLGMIYLLGWRWTIYPLVHAWRHGHVGWFIAILLSWVFLGAGWLLGLIYRSTWDPEPTHAR